MVLGFRHTHEYHIGHIGGQNPEGRNIGAQENCQQHPDSSPRSLLESEMIRNRQGDGCQQDNPAQGLPLISVTGRGSKQTATRA